MDVNQRNNEFTVADGVDTSNDENISYPATVVACKMLRELLTLPDYTLTRIAIEINTSTATVRRLLKGSTQNPSVRTFDKIVRLYCSVSHRFNTIELMAGNKEMIK